MGHLWKMKKKLNPKCRDPPTAMKDEKGNLVTSPELIESMSLKVFKERLNNREMKQAGAELGQAQPKLGPELDLSNLNFVA